MMLDLSKPELQIALMEVKSAYLNLEVGEFSEFIIADALTNGTARIIFLHNNRLNDQLDKDNVKSKTLRLIHIHRFYGDVYRFNRSMENLKEAMNKETLKTSTDNHA